MTLGRPSLPDRVPAPVLFLGSGFTQYCGAALAIGLFAVIPAASVAWWRLAVSAVVLLAWRRPWRQSWTRRELGAAGSRTRLFTGATHLLHEFRRIHACIKYAGCL